ncbi:MAG: exonuclease SbcCD subunit D C-terminal domain-containing protein [Planctomycetaceae bacterium]|nr:exonuclease SbcCD subunit D C-terminal domain-containing protein [Planctomycetaceae bacterium]
MKILHTSDWHLGRYLYTKRRYEEFERFLDWLLERIETEQVHCLIVAGDIFDTTTPSPRAQQLYFDFLAKIVKTDCRHVVIIAGNHDSPSLLDASGTLLKSLHIHVVSRIENPGVLVLNDPTDTPELIVCAVPFLRDQDVRKSKPGETWDEKRQNSIEGVREYYLRIGEEASQVQQRLGVPIIATGHLFTAGGQTVEGDAVRELFVGSLGGVPVDVFPDCFDYVALGHLHIPQKVAGSETIRYSGSPIPMGFGEAVQDKFVNLVVVEKDKNRPEIVPIPVPRFQEMKRLQGDWPGIAAEIESLKSEKGTIWLEIDYRGDLIGDLQARIDQAIADSNLEVLRIINRPRMEKDRLLGDYCDDSQTLADFSVEATFRRCLESSSIAKDRHEDIFNTFQDVWQMRNERSISS